MVDQFMSTYDLHGIKGLGGAVCSTIGMRGLRDVLGCYATGVAIVTTRTNAGEHVAVTVNSFASLSLDPPLIPVLAGQESKYPRTLSAD